MPGKVVRHLVTHQHRNNVLGINKYGANKKGVEPKRISEMKWKKPHRSKKGMLIMSVLVCVWLFAQTGVTCG